MIVVSVPPTSPTARPPASCCPACGYGFTRSRRCGPEGGCTSSPGGGAPAGMAEALSPSGAGLRETVRRQRGVRPSLACHAHEPSPRPPGFPAVARTVPLGRRVNRPDGDTAGRAPFGQAAASSCGCPERIGDQRGAPVIVDRPAHQTAREAVDHRHQEQELAATCVGAGGLWLAVSHVLGLAVFGSRRETIRRRSSDSYVTFAATGVPIAPTAWNTDVDLGRLVKTKLPGGAETTLAHALEGPATRTWSVGGPRTARAHRTGHA